MRPFTTAIIAPNVMPLTDNPGYGGTERVVQELVNEWSMTASADQTVYCARGSVLPSPTVRLVPTTPSAYPPHFMHGELSAEYLLSHPAEIDGWRDLSECYLQQYESMVVESLLANPPDIIDCHVQTPGMLKRLDGIGIPLLAHVHNDPHSLRLPVLRNGRYVALSEHQHRRLPARIEDAIITVPGIAQTEPVVEPDEICELPEPITELLASERNFLVYIGAIARRKSVKTALYVALANKIPIVVAGPVLAWSSAHLADTAMYFRRYIEPLIDNQQIYYAPSVNGPQRDKLMSAAVATIVTSSHEDSSWQEPFGRVVPESLRCGTPVVASHRTHGAVDYMRNSPNLQIITSSRETIDVGYLHDIDHTLCRAEGAKLFNASRYAAVLMTTMQQLAVAPDIARIA